MVRPGHRGEGATPPVVLTIAGSDSGGGAGIAADLRTLAGHHVHGALAVTAVTAQNTRGVQRVEAMPTDLVVAQIESVLNDLGAAAVKTGFLATPATVRAVTDLARRGSLPNLVVDPVLVSSSGSPLFAGTEMRDAYLALLPLACVITPNHREAALLAGLELEGLAAIEATAHELRALGPDVVVITGGRFRLEDEAVDVAYDGHAVTLLRAPWLETRNVHGTGCSLSAAIAADLALGVPPLQAALAAKAFVHHAIELSASWELGSGHGPIDQLGAAYHTDERA